MRDLTYFISDLHLGARYIRDPKAHERLVVEFLHSIAPRARRLFLLGDVLDYWWEYKTVVPRGYTRFFGALAELADAGVEITWFKGNHDIWIFDYLPVEIGFTLRDGAMITEIDGKKFFLEHGDGVGDLPRSFKMLRSLFRCTTAQRLYSLLPPRLTIGFARRWSSHSRKAGGYAPAPENPEENSLVRFARDYNRRNPGENIDYFVFGHQHIMLDTPVPPSSRVVILGDWISRFSYAVFDGHELKLTNFSSDFIDEKRV